MPSPLQKQSKAISRLSMLCCEKQRSKESTFQIIEKGMKNHRLNVVLILSQAIVIIGLLSWFFQEGQANPYLGTWISQNLPLASLVLNGWVVFGTSITLLGIVVSWIIKTGKNTAGPYSSNLSSMSKRHGSKAIGNIQLTTRILGRLPAMSSVLLLLASVSLATSVFTERTILAFIGLGLLFLGLIPVYLLHQGEMQQSAANSSSIEALRSPHVSETRIVYVPFLEGRKLPKENLAVRIQELPPTFSSGLTISRTKSPKLERVSAPGSEILKRLEKTLALDFSDVKPSFIAKRLPTALVELSLATAANIENTGDRFIVKIAGSSFAKACEDITRLGPSTDSLGCELCSAIALAFAKSSNNPIVIEDTVASAGSSQIETTYRVLSSEEVTTLALGRRQ